MNKEILEQKLSKLIARRERALKEKDTLLALDLEFRIEQTKKNIAKK